MDSESLRVNQHPSVIASQVEHPLAAEYAFVDSELLVASRAVPLRVFGSDTNARHVNCGVDLPGFALMPGFAPCLTTGQCSCNPMNPRAVLLSLRSAAATLLIQVRMRSPLATMRR